MSRQARNRWLAPMLLVAAAGIGSEALAQQAPSTRTLQDDTVVAGGGASATIDTAAIDTAAIDKAANETAADSASTANGGNPQSTSGRPQEATRPNTLFPSWALQSTRPIDPRIAPNAGLRVPTSYYPIAGGPRLFHNYSSSEPDFFGTDVTSPWTVRESVALFGVGDDRTSSKFEEYRDVHSGVTAGIEAHYRVDNTIFNVLGRQIGRKDQDISIDGGEIGSYLFGVTFNETPHTYAYDAKSLYSGAGTNALTLPDAMQADLQTSTSMQQLSAKMLGYVASGAQNLDEATVRQNLGADLTIIATYPFVLKASASNESRDGLRPWSGSFGFDNFVEIPWPVKYDTHEFRVTGEYAKPESNYYANASFRVSDFVDHIESFTFDNPDRVTDAAGGLACMYNCGPAMGRMTLYPSNQYYEVSGTFVAKKLPLDSTFNAFVSEGYMRQNEHLVPFSTNSADPLMHSPTDPSFNATDPSGLPRQTAETAMDTTTVQLRWTANPTKAFRLNAQYRFYGLDNNETPFTMSEFVREDEDIRLPETLNGTYSTVLAQYSKHTFSLEGTYQFSMLSKITGVYTFERMNRDFREIKWSNDNKLKVEYDTVLFGSVDLKSWFERTQRTTSKYEFDQYNIVQGNPSGHPMFPFIEKFDETPFNRNEIQGMATYALNDANSISAHVEASNTDYNVVPLGELSMLTENVTTQVSDAMQFGVRKDSMYSVGLDYTYSPVDNFSLFAEAGIERRAYQSMSRQWTVNGISDPYLKEPTLSSFSNWIADVRDNYYTGGVGMDATITPKLKFTMQYVFSKSDGHEGFTSPVGTAANDTNAFVPQPFDDVDDTTTQSLNPELKYEYSNRLSMAAGYEYEMWHVNDYNYQGFTYAPVYNAGVALLMGGLLPKPYTQNTVYIRVKMGF